MNKEELKRHYSGLLKAHGDSAGSAQYSSRESQEKRFEILSSIAPLDGCKVLDFGCGSGHFATYLGQQGIDVDYTGVDIVDEFFPIAQEKHPQHRFGQMDDFANETFDYAFVSGVFNNRMNDNTGFYQQTLVDLFSRVKEGLAFNMMSKYVDYEDDGLFYVYPEEVFSFVKKNLTPYVSLRNDYQVKPDTVPFEFAVYAIKI